MSGTRQKGYTIIEVTLFLAISGALFAIALLGTGSTIRSIRFTDSGRSLTAFMQQQYDIIVKGVNTRSTDIACTNGTVTNSAQTAGTSNCLLLGKLLVVQNNSFKVTTYDIIGSEPAGVDYNKTDEELIKLFQPRVVTAGAASAYDIPWEATINGQKRQDGQATNAIALIRSPRSTRVVQYSFKVPDASALSNLQTVVNNPTTNMNKQVTWCVESADKLGTVARLTVGDAPNQSAIKIEFDQTPGVCNGV